MKSSPLALVFLAAAGVAHAAMSTSDCAQMCIDNMNAKASQLGCSEGDTSCLCSKPDYKYGVRDCTTQACPQDNSAQVVQMALANCPNGSSNGGSTTASTNSTMTGSGASTTGSNGSATKSGMTTTTMTGANGKTTTTTSSTSGTITSGTGSNATATGAGAGSGSGSGSANNNGGNASVNGNGSGSGSGSGSGNGSGSTSSPGKGKASSTTGGALPLATVGSGAMGALGVAALLVL